MFDPKPNSDHIDPTVDAMVLNYEDAKTLYKLLFKLHHRTYLSETIPIMKKMVDVFPELENE